MAKQYKTFREFWVDNHTATDGADGFPRYASARRVTCVDGFTVSIQASSRHYCSPREYLETGNYSSWELGYPSESDDLIAEYAEDKDALTNTVYGYVPNEIVESLLQGHGGISIEGEAA